MRYWVFDPAKNDAQGPYEPDALRTLPGLGPETLIALVGATSPGAWKPAHTHEELGELFRGPQPLPPNAKSPPLAPAVGSTASAPTSEWGGGPAAKTEQFKIEPKPWPVNMQPPQATTGHGARWYIQYALPDGPPSAGIADGLTHDQALKFVYKLQSLKAKVFQVKPISSFGVSASPPEQKAASQPEQVAPAQNCAIGSCPKCGAVNHLDAIACEKCESLMPVYQEPSTVLKTMQECLDRGISINMGLIEVYPSVLQDVTQHLRRWYYRRDAHEAIKPQVFMPAVVLVTTIKVEHERLKIERVRNSASEKNGWGERSGFASPSGYRETVRTYHLDGSDSSFECSCDHGYVPCAIQESCCSRRDCFQCHGSGHRNCSSCGGSGKRRCGACLGGTVYHHSRVIVKHWPETIRFAWTDPSSEDWAKTLPAKALLRAQGDKLFDAGGPLPQTLIAMAQQSVVAALIAKTLQQFVEMLKPHLERHTPRIIKSADLGSVAAEFKKIRLTHTTVYLVPAWKVGYDYKGGSGHFLVVGKDRRVLRCWQWPLMHWPRIIGAVILAFSLAGLGAFEIYKETVVSGRLLRWTQALLDAVAVAKAARQVAIPPAARISAKKFVAETKLLDDSTAKADPSGKAAGVRPERSAIAKLPGMGLSGIQWKSCPGLLRTMTSRKNVLGKFGPEVVAAAAVEYEKYHCAEWVEAHPAEATINSE